MGEMSRSKNRVVMKCHISMWPHKDIHYNPGGGQGREKSKPCGNLFN